jgi:hypothetical protein
MKRRHGLRSAALALVLAAGPAIGASPDDTLPSAAEVLDCLRQRLPDQPVRIRGLLLTSGRRPADSRRLHVDMDLHLTPDTASARYLIRDAFGETLEQMTVLRQSNQPPRLGYAAGPDLTPQPAPELPAPLRATAMSWADLTLDFLWWRDGTVAGRQEVRGQPCYVVDLRPPAGGRPPYARVRLWIDTRACVMLQAEGYTAAGERLRRLTVKSVKRLDDQWMIKDLEVEQFPQTVRTRLRVTELTPPAAASP